MVKSGSRTLGMKNPAVATVGRCRLLVITLIEVGSSLKRKVVAKLKMKGNELPVTLLCHSHPGQGSRGTGDPCALAGRGVSNYLERSQHNRKDSIREDVLFHQRAHRGEGHGCVTPASHTCQALFQGFAMMAALKRLCLSSFLQLPVVLLLAPLLSMSLGLEFLECCLNQTIIAALVSFAQSRTGHCDCKTHCICVHA